MKPRRFRSKPRVIPNSRWAVYAAAGAASAIAGSATCEAEIHYSGIVNHSFDGTTNATLPLGRRVKLRFSHSSGGGSGNANIRVLGASSSAFVADFVNYGGLYVYNLAPRLNL